MFQQPRELVERRNTAGRVFQHFGLRRVHGAQRLPCADLPMQLFQRQQRAEMPRVDREHILPRLNRLAVLVLSLQNLCLSREQGDALRRLLSEFYFAFEIGEQMGPVVLLGAHTRASASTAGR